MLSKSFIKKIKETLIQEKQELLSKTKIDSDIESVDLDGDEIDEIQGALLIEMHNKITSRYAEKISQINDALQRIEDLTYGICNDCDENIPEKRLTTNPYFLTCVSCAEDREVVLKQRRN
jgi:DnaK suppressor protein